MTKREEIDLLTMQYLALLKRVETLEQRVVDLMVTASREKYPRTVHENPPPYVSLTNDQPGLTIKDHTLNTLHPPVHQKPDGSKPFAHPRRGIPA